MKEPRVGAEGEIWENSSIDRGKHNRHEQRGSVEDEIKVKCDWKGHQTARKSVLHWRSMHVKERLKYLIAILPIFSRTLTDWYIFLCNPELSNERKNNFVAVRRP
jgi:hypothetical protein